jgi:integrase
VLLCVHIEPTFGKSNLNAITAEAVRRWHANVSTDSGAMTAAKSYRLLRAILATAVSDGLTQTNPCRVRGAGVERSAERPIVGPDLVLALADAIGPRWRAMILLAGFGGLRLGELLALRQDHVDLDAGTVTVAEQVVNLEGGRRLVTEPKTDAGRRMVALPQLVIDAVAEHLKLHDDPDAPLFPAEDGGLLPATTFYKHWRRARREIGRDDLHLHDLRHVAGTLAAWTGATERELMARLGHANPAAARRYQHAARDRDRSIAAGLNTILLSLQDSSAR